ncbi:hypothetical protein BDP67DRAFT_589967 [Colletotrichum lupini]|nr:hypothetical protein BDP67DRAFT_589967 [Colletotrichum lupini]
MSYPGSPEFDAKNLEMSDIHFQGFGMLNNGLPNDLTHENAPDALEWFDESLMDEVVASMAVPEAEVSPFEADLSFIDDLAVPSIEKKWMFDLIFNDIIPYRFNDHFRLFPNIEFYRVLFYNRSDLMEIWGFVVRFHDWMSAVAASSPHQADEAIEALKFRATFYGWPGMLQKVSVPEAQPAENLSAQQQQELAIASAPPTATPSKEATEKSPRTQPLDQAEHQHALLKSELTIASTFQHKGIVQSMEHFKELDDAYGRYIKRAAGNAPQDDPSWPVSSEQQQAITDTSNFFELRKARERLANIAGSQERQEPDVAENPRKRHRGPCGRHNSEHSSARPKGMSKTDWALVNSQSTPVDLLEAVIHHRITAIEVELICWRLLKCAMEQQLGYTMRPLWSGPRTASTWEQFNTFSQRWSSICENLQVSASRDKYPQILSLFFANIPKDCKMIIHSLTRADWFCKFAGAPSKERGAKLSNDLLNGRRDIQNQVGRDTIKEKTSRQDWITSDDFEIRDKAGELVLKGGHLGDRKRRALAIRSQGGISG